MANPTKMEGLRTALLEATTTEATITLEKDYRYELTHSGVEDDDTAADVTIFLSTDSGTAAAAGVGAHLGRLRKGDNLKLGVGVTSLRFKSVSGSPVFTIAASFYTGGSF